MYATIAANGVECTPIAITEMTSQRGKSYKVPSANCHQAIDPKIAQTAAYAINQGVTTAGGNAVDAQLANNRKTFAKTGTNEDTYMLTAGFVPQVATFVGVGNAESPQSFNYKTINGVTRPTWYGMYIAEPAWKKFMQTYLDSANIPIDNNYGDADPKYMTGTGSKTGTSVSSGTTTYTNRSTTNGTTTNNGTTGNTNTNTTN